MSGMVPGRRSGRTRQHAAFTSDPFYYADLPVLMAILPAMTFPWRPSSLSPPPDPGFTVDILPLPKIQSERIRKRIFTHSSLADYRYDFQVPENDPSTDNEE